MHIIQILPALNQGGVERYVVDLNRALTGLGHQSTVISAGGTLVQEIENSGGRHIPLDVCSKNPLTFLKRASDLRSLISDLSPDILHAHSRVPAWLCLFANKPLQLPFITTVHGFNHVGRYSRIMTQGDTVVCVSNAVKTFILQHYNTPQQKIKVIPCGVNPEYFDPKKTDEKWMDGFKNQFNLHGKQIITTVGRISRTKDYKTFIRAIAAGSETHPNLCGLIVGSSTARHQQYRTQLNSLIRELNMEHRIVFAGAQTRLPEIYALSDIVVSCSRKPETFGLTLTEALAMNTPVIATRHGGPLDIIQEGINGHFFTPGDVESLTEQILTTLATPPENPRQNITQRFSIDQMAQQIIQVYQQLQS
jgi:glycosyltransferase involved in cell wall biosynthesis